eukprot:SM000004S14907  [mRNA]  locus=s4:88880:91615:- [translate_table: standard]
MANRSYWEACNFNGSELLAGVEDGGSEGFVVRVTRKPAYYACPVRPHCILGMKVIIQAGLGNAATPESPPPPAEAQGYYPLEWADGALDYSQWAAEHDLRVGDSVGLQYSCCHTVYRLVSEQAFQTCNFTGAAKLAGEPNGTRSGVTIKVTAAPQYIACIEGPPGIPIHCIEGQKLVVAATDTITLSAPSTVAPGNKGSILTIGGPQGWVSGGPNYTQWALSTPLTTTDIVAFKYLAFHEVMQFPDRKAYDICNFNHSVSLANETHGRGHGFLVPVTSSPKYYGCPVGPHCMQGMKVVIQAGLGQASLAVPPPPYIASGYWPLWWNDGSLNYTRWSEVTTLYDGDQVGLQYSCCHNVWRLPNVVAYQTCNFTGATKLAVETNGLMSGTIINVTLEAQYIACSEGPPGLPIHCIEGQKVVIRGTPLPASPAAAPSNGPSNAPAGAPFTSPGGPPPPAPVPIAAPVPVAGPAAGPAAAPSSPPSAGSPPASAPTAPPPPSTGGRLPSAAVASLTGLLVSGILLAATS